uniref:Uncharacterized protein n=1 Tax=Grammatophora oceanica TaxID=210454 RepID=A0A7S1V2A4_9STRA|mmetsp:Transcript_32111/g.47747  ORF Transcript_32111/g.47747 Transcript_32111/m.47747 type:complete len:103 (+) Transcript_32111:2-310(+)
MTTRQGAKTRKTEHQADDGSGADQPRVAFVLDPVLCSPLPKALSRITLCPTSPMSLHPKSSSLQLSTSTSKIRPSSAITSDFGMCLRSQISPMYLMPGGTAD